MGNAAENPTGGKPPQVTLPERFWSLARGMEDSAEDDRDPDPAAVVKHVLAVMDAFERGETSTEDVSIRTLSFLKLLRQAELRGEISYAAPEQIRGETVDERSLVFSVGVLLFERLTGRHPFGSEGDRPRRMARMQKGEFGSGVNYFPTVPPGLRRILMRAMGPFPEERWDNLKDMREHLQDFVAHDDPGVRLPGTTQPKPRTQTETRKSRKPRKPASDSQTTRVVDMSERVQMEQAAVAKRRTGSEQAAAPAGSGAAKARAANVPDSANQSGARIVIAPPPEAAGEIDFGDAPDVRPHLFGAAAPLVWAAIGAAAATLVFFLFFRSEAAPVAPVQAGPATGDTAPVTGDTAPVTAETTPATAETAPPQTPPAAATPTPATTPAPAATAPAPTGAQPAAAPVAAIFDPQRSGELALDMAFSCFDEKSRRRGISFGAGLLFDSTDGHVRKVYYSGTEELTGDQRKCFRDKMATFSTRTPPEKNQIIDYQFRIRDDKRSAKARQPK